MDGNFSLRIRSKRGFRMRSKVGPFPGKSSRTRRLTPATREWASRRVRFSWRRTSEARSTVSLRRRALRSSSASASGVGAEARDPLEFLTLGKPVEAPRLPRELGQPRGAQETRFEIAAVAVGEVVRGAVALLLLVAEARGKVVVLEEQRSESGGDGSLVLEGEEEGARQVLVDLALELELEPRRAPLEAGAVEQIEEVAHLLGEGAEGRQVLPGKVLPRVGPGKRKG